MWHFHLSNQYLPLSRLQMITNVRGVESIIDAWDGDVNIKSVLVLNCLNMMQRMILKITYI